MLFSYYCLTTLLNSCSVCAAGTHIFENAAKNFRFKQVSSLLKITMQRLATSMLKKDGDQALKHMNVLKFKVNILNNCKYQICLKSLLFLISTFY